MAQAEETEPKEQEHARSKIRDPEGRMTLFEHLAELRTRLLRCVIAILILGVGCLVFSKQLYGILMIPVLAGLPPEASQLVYTSAIESLNVFMKVGLYGGVIASAPVILWQIWGFVSPGLYPSERKLAMPFVLSGTFAFIVGVCFCYFVMLPKMFQFLLREETATALKARLDTAHLREEDALRYLRLGDAGEAGKVGKVALDQLTAAGDGQADSTKSFLDITLVPKKNVDVMRRLDGLGRLVDATATGYGSASRAVLLQVMEKRLAAIDSYGKMDFDDAVKKTDEAAALLAGVAQTHAEDFGTLWSLERNIAYGSARFEEINWTKPMLAMDEQLTLVLVLLLAFGVIFELPVVMALLAMVGLVKSRWLFKYQRHAFIVCLIVAAIITPTGDPINLSLMAGPMILCYEIGVFAVWMIERRRAKRQAAETTAITPTT